MPITLPVGPTFLAAKKQSNPPPDPKSMTVSPYFKLAIAVGLPQPRPKFANSLTSDNSSFV